jgi:hypothetical protein
MLPLKLLRYGCNDRKSGSDAQLRYVDPIQRIDKMVNLSEGVWQVANVGVGRDFHG